MKLQCSDEELNQLIQHGVVEPKNNHEFRIYLKADLTGQSRRLEIECSNNVVYANSEGALPTTMKEKSIDEIYSELRDLFPVDTLSLFGREGGRNLRSGRKDKIIAHLKKHRAEGYNLSAIVTAAKYEIWSRFTTSTGSENKLDFMQGLEAWLNNTGNIDGMIERANNSRDFLNTLENEGDGNKVKSGRKVKLA